MWDEIDFVGGTLCIGDETSLWIRCTCGVDENYSVNLLELKPIICENCGRIFTVEFSVKATAPGQDRWKH